MDLWLYTMKFLNFTEAYNKLFWKHTQIGEEACLENK